MSPLPASGNLRSAARRLCATGSPALPLGLNLGIQLNHLEQADRPWPDTLYIVSWPQYWAWRLSGVMASEVTSLGCHSDLWRPLENRYGELAVRRGWAKRFPPAPPRR